MAVKYLGLESMPTLKPSEGMSGVRLTEEKLVYHTLPTTYIIGSKNCTIILNDLIWHLFTATGYSPGGSGR
jgi:hypothetical protein